MCERCGNPACTGKVYVQHASYNPMTGELVPLPPGDPTAMYDQSLASMKELINNILTQWRKYREVKHPNDFEAFMQLTEMITDLFPPPISTNIAVVAIIMLNEFVDATDALPANG
jgi:hypothetical protein